MSDRARERERMVETQIASRGIRDARVLDAMRAVLREAFVPEHLSDLAYEDGPLPIGEGQTISQPYIVALMAEAAAIGPGDRVLEIGAGSGYGAAVLSRLAGSVHAIERHGALARAAGERLGWLGYANVSIREGDGTLGWPEAAPFDAILVTAVGPEVPERLSRQLAPGGRLVMPVGRRAGGQRLLRLTRRDETVFDETDLGFVSFVPLIGAHAYRED